MEKRALSDQAVCDMHKLMLDPTINSKVELATRDGKKYSKYDIDKDGTVILGVTRFRFWNQLIGCQRKLSFESWALAVWDALIDLSIDENAKALEEGLSVEIAKEAQRGGNYEWVVKRLTDCYMHVCNRGDAVSAGTRDENGSSAPRKVYVNNDSKLTLNINANGLNRIIRVPDATGRAFLRFNLGVTGVEVEKD